MVNIKSRDDISSETPLRIGTVPFCNAWPLIHYLPEHLPGCSISTLLPSSMQFRLISHHLDLVLMPVVELMNIPTGVIVGDACIGCFGAVESVLLISKKPISRIRNVALDTASRSSVSLADVLFRTFYGTNPEKYQLKPEADLENSPADAMVVIGDRALAFEPSDRWEHRYDLGELWYEHTGLPFVFAAWIACTNKQWKKSGRCEALQKARDRGVDSIDTIIRENAGKLPVRSVHRISDYLSTAIHYKIGDLEKQGLNQFLDLAYLHHVVPQRLPVTFIE